jgi:hypothetical protein
MLKKIGDEHKFVPFLFGSLKNLYYLCTCNREVTGAVCSQGRGRVYSNLHFFIIKKF